MTLPPPRLSRATLRRTVAVLDAPTHGFVELVRTAGLDRAQHFRGALLDGVDFGTDDLSGFDFSGTDLTGADLSRATGLDKIIVDANTRLPAHALHPPPEFDRAMVRRMVLAGETPPTAWRPFITALQFYGTTLTDLSPLSDQRCIAST